MAGLNYRPADLGWCSVQLTVGRLYAPHMLEIHYPTDRHQNAIFVLSEDTRFTNLHQVRPGDAIVRLSSGTITDGPSGRGVARYIYWPNRKNPVLTIVNAGRGLLDAPVVDEIRMYEIDDGLPAWTPPAGSESDLMLGPFVERVDRTTARLFYDGPLEAKFTRDQIDGYFPGYYAAWFRTVANLVRYLRFSGQDTYYAGIYMYYAGWFPSPAFQGDAESGADYLPAGWSGGAVDLMASMFRQNDLSLVLGIQFIGSRRILDADHVSDESVRKGAPSPRFVTAQGRQVEGLSGRRVQFHESPGSR